MPKHLVAALGLTLAPALGQDAATGTAAQTEFAGTALAHLGRAESVELARHVGARPYRASTLVHNLLRQSAGEGGESWALDAARGVASALAASEDEGVRERGVEALAQVDLYAALDDTQRAARLEFDALWMRVAEDMNTGDRQAAETHAAAANECARVVADPWLDATAQRRSGRLYLDLGDLQGAIESTRSATISDERYGHWFDVAASHALLGRAQLVRGAPGLALREYEASIAAAAHTDRRAPFDPLDFGALLARVGRFDRAHKILGEALERADSGADRAAALIALGTLANAEGRYDEARTLTTEGIDLARAEALPHAEASARIALGGLEAELAQPDAARRQLERALGLLEGVDAPIRRACAWSHLATVELDAGRPDEALDAIARAAAIYEEIDHASGRREALAVSARALDARGDFDAAETAWLDCAARSDRAGEVPAAARARVALAESLARRNEYERAARAATDALAGLASVELPELRWRADTVLAHSFAASGYPSESLAAFERALDTLESLRADVKAPSVRSDYFDQRTAVYRAAAIAFLGAGDIERAFDAAEGGKARALLETFGARPDSTAVDGDLAAARGRLRRAERRYAAAAMYSDARVAGGERESARADLRDARLSLERSRPVRAALGGLGASPAIADVAGALPGQTVLVEYVLGTDSSAAIVIGEDGLAGVRLPWPEAAVRERVERLLAPMGRLRKGRTDASNLGFDVTAARELYDALVRPLEPHLRGAEAVVIVPDGVLWRAPLAALVKEVHRAPIDPARLYTQHAAHRYWIDDVVIRVAPSAAALVAWSSRPARPGSGALFFADPDPLPEGALALPFASTEIERASAARPGRSLAGADASEVAFRSLAPDARWLHLAVHGYVDHADPLHSRLALGRGGEGDGWLHAFEIETLDLRLDLVVLSACEGAGDARSGEGILGLTRAFLAAGARSVLASRWMIEDRCTAEFMGRYYRALGEGDSPARALAAAQRWAAHEGGRPGASYAHPFFWAGFVLVGGD